MSYKIQILENVVWVRYVGSVDGLDIIEHYNDPIYVDNIRKYKKVIYDYSQNKNSDISLDDIREFAVLAKLEASIHGSARGILIPSNADGIELANQYIKLLENSGWELSLASNMEEALQLLSN